MPQILVARSYVIAAPAAAFWVGPCPWGEAHVICDHTAGSVDFGDWAAAAIHEMLVNTLGISAGSHAAAEAANAIATS